MPTHPSLKLAINLLLTASLSATLPCPAQASDKPLLIHAARVFDGTSLKTDTSVLISQGKILQIGAPDSFKNTDAERLELGDATLLPGLIDLHTHVTFQHVPELDVLKHGITTVRDVGGPVHQPYGGDGALRVLTSGLILTPPDGYPIPGMGAENIALPVATVEQARAAVRQQIDGGAVVIKIALEPGGEMGAPWASGHHHGHGQAQGHHAPAHSEHEGHGNPHHPAPHAGGHPPAHAPQSGWPLFSADMVKAIVDEAHRHQRKVTAHLAEAQGAKLALDAGVDEWAHVPCEPLPEALLKQAAAQGVQIVTTIDTLSKCPGIAHNVSQFSALGVDLLYGAEIAHPDIPWGIDAQELMAMMQMANMPPLTVLHTATATAGEHLHIPLLGTLQAGAPADLIAIPGDALKRFKKLEYPELVISGGKIIVNHFKP